MENHAILEYKFYRDQMEYECLCVFDLFDLVEREHQMGLKIFKELAVMIGQRLKDTNDALLKCREDLEKTKLGLSVALVGGCDGEGMTRSGCLRRSCDDFG